MSAVKSAILRPSVRSKQLDGLDARQTGIFSLKLRQTWVP